MPVEEIITWLLVLLPFAFGCLFFIVVGAILLGAVFFFIKTFSGVWTRANQTLSRPTEEYLAEVTPNLLPWTPDAPADFSSKAEVAGQQILSSLHYRGKVKSLSRPEAAGWLVFDFQVKRLR